MNEQRKPGRPRKHLEDEHHFRTSDEAVESADVESSIALENRGAGYELEPAMYAHPDNKIYSETIEAIVENPTSAIINPTIGLVPQVDSSVHIAEGLSSTNGLVDNSIVAIENGWHCMDVDIVLNLPPRNGMPIRLSEKPDGDGVMAFWKKTRKFANSTHRWAESGKWVNFNTGLDISFDPKYWKERF